MLPGISLSPAFGKHSSFTTDVRCQNCCPCLDLICDRGVRTKGSRKFVPGKRHPPIPCFVYEHYNKVEASAMRAVGEIPSSNNVRLQNLVES
ncbi:hypothetical protein F2Q69_00007322 [Brassica cretica]|uniref:Uncharacterized protein n=1 Tax=Brassica cretica TaxID=69181 RepID=A0A8S9NQK1_BRACR|nr:hypothetical protein F2Q69_00007322 [Brassica cretica]